MYLLVVLADVMVDGMVLNGLIINDTGEGHASCYIAAAQLVAFVAKYGQSRAHVYQQLEALPRAGIKRASQPMLRHLRNKGAVCSKTGKVKLITLATASRICRELGLPEGVCNSCKAPPTATGAGVPPRAEPAPQHPGRMPSSCLPTGKGNTPCGPTTQCTSLFVG